MSSLAHDNDDEARGQARPRPPTRLGLSQDEDPLRPARGCVLACLLGCACWELGWVLYQWLTP